MRDENFSHEGRLRELGCSAWKEDAQGDHTHTHKHQIGGSYEEGDRLSSVMPSGGARGNGPKLTHKKLHLHTRKSFFTGGVVRHWAKMLREVVEYLSLESLNEIDHGPGQPAIAI